MSAALVESVREALRIDVDVPCDGCKSLDLPAILAALTEAESLRAQVAEATTKCPHCGVGFLQAGEMQRVLDGVKDIRADYIRLTQEQATYYEHAKAKERETITVSRKLAASQAREVALSRMLDEWYQAHENGNPAVDSNGEGVGVCIDFTRDFVEQTEELLDAPTDTAALRAFGERCVVETLRYMQDNWDDFSAEEWLAAMCSPNHTDSGIIVDRVLGGS